MSNRGKFITFEGLDGSGKSTQLELLAAWLRQRGPTVVTTREPGGTSLGEALRGLVVARDAGTLAPEAELAIMVAARAQHVAAVILPALERGDWVLCDRFHDATAAYQGGGRGLPLGTIATLHRLLCRDLQPDRTLYLMLPTGESLARARALLAGASSSEGRFEAEQTAFFERVAAAYDEIANAEPRFRRVPATGDIAAVASRVRAAMADLTTGLLD